jgi:protein TonB
MKGSMKESSSYGWAILAALLLHGALALVLNATVRFRAPVIAGPISLQLEILPPPEAENKALRAAVAAVVPRPEVARETVAEEAKPKEPETIPAPERPLEAGVLPQAEPQLQASQVVEGATASVTASFGEAETLEREVSARTGANGTTTALRDVVLEARPLSAIDPLFPIGSRIRGEQGDVRFQVWISAAGKLERTQILQTSGYPALDEAAERALKKTRFAPREVNGNSVAGTLTIVVRFQLDG